MFDLTRILLTLPGLVVGFVFHEFAHAWVADRLGDPTPRSQGKLTLHPVTHIDPIGFLLILVVGFGWAKPVVTNSRYFKKPRRDNILVSIAGPVTNLLIAILFALILKLLILTGVLGNMGFNLQTQTFNLFLYTMNINILLFVLNLLPIPGLDGFHVLASLVPYKHYNIIYKLEQYSMIIFLLLIFTRVTRYIIGVPVSLILSLIISLIGL